MRRLLAVPVALVLVFGALPATAEGPPFLSDNLEIVGAHPDITLISTEFFSDAPVMVASTLTGVRTYDISDPEQPQLRGGVPMAMFQNENVKLGERENGTKFVLMGYDAFGFSPTFDATDVGGTHEMVVINVTDPANPFITARIETDARTHTIGCADDACTYAYTSGDALEDGDVQASFDVIDLSDLTNPQIVDHVEGPQVPNDSFGSPIGHDWDVDAAGVAWWVGTGGIAAYDVTDPSAPRLLNSSDAEHSTDPEWNHYVSHNSQRPNAEAFAVESDGNDRGARGRGPDGAGPPGLQRDDEEQASGASGEPDPDKGNVLLVTEEDLADNSCEPDHQGGFQTWHVPELGGVDFAEGEHGEPRGTITPLDRWEPEELPQLGVNYPVAAFCSAHYFDQHEDLGVVAQGWYQHGLRILDYSDPHNIEQVGYYLSGGAQETWGARWVPEYDEDGQHVGKRSDLLYTEDPTRGMEILRVDSGDLDDERRAPVPSRLMTPSTDPISRKVGH